MNLAATMTEKELMEAIIEAAGRLGWRCYHTFDSRRSAGGFPDLICVKDGVVLVYECKTATGRFQPFQQEWLEEFDGAVVQTSRVVRPADLDDVLDELRGAA